MVKFLSAMKLEMGLLIVGIVLSASASAQVVHEFRADGEDQTLSDALRFFTGSCAEIAYLSDVQKRVLVDGRNADDFGQFCFPEDPYECTDYNQTVSGFGTLSTNEGGYFCRFSPH